MHDSSEADVASDEHVAGSREVGGTRGRRSGTGDGAGTTGTEENEEFVGRVAGQDAGYAGETGAEARAEEARRDQA